jgi:hypothetical protein
MNKKQYQKKYRKNLNKYQSKFYIKNLEEWKEYFIKFVKCEICGKSISFNSGSIKKSIHFDHRMGGVESIKGSPTFWLYRHRRNKKNETIWNSCNFGKLCYRCNKFLPTVDREKWLKKALKYQSSLNEKK